MPICQESFSYRALHMPHATCSAVDATQRDYMYIMSRRRVLPPIGALSESTDKDSVLNICERITVKNVQSQPSLTQSARAAMSNNVRINRADPMCCICCGTSFQKGQKFKFYSMPILSNGLIV